jgi:hypothetical protein
MIRGTRSLAGWRTRGGLPVSGRCRKVTRRCEMAKKKDKKKDKKSKKSKKK